MRPVSIPDELIDWLLAGDVAIQYQVRRDLLDEERPDLQARIAVEGLGCAVPGCSPSRRPLGPGVLPAQVDLDALHAAGPEAPGHCAGSCPNPREHRPDPGAAQVSRRRRQPGEDRREQRCLRQRHGAQLRRLLRAPGGVVAVYRGLSDRRADARRRLQLRIQPARRRPQLAALDDLGAGGYCRVSGQQLHLPRRRAGRHRPPGVGVRAATPPVPLRPHRRGHQPALSAVVLSLALVLRHLRALDCFRSVGAGYDPRMQDALDVLLQKRRGDGAWPLQAKHPGQVHFDMEAAGQPSRWNTLLALRVLKHFGG
jgi:hypothetical protein